MRRNNTGIIVLIVLAAVIVFGGMFYAIFLKLADIGNVAIQAAAENSALEMEKVKLEQLEMLTEKDSAIAAYVNTCQKMMPSTPEESILLEYIQNAASEVMANIAQIRFDERAPGEKYTAMPLNISFEGKYTDLVNLLGKLRNGDRAIRVDGINVALAENNTQTIKAEISGKAFYLGSEKAK